MDSALLAGQMGAAGLGLSTFSTSIDLVRLVKAGLHMWNELNTLDDEVKYFKSQLTLQRDIFETWQSDWFNFRPGVSMSIGRMRILKQHQETVNTTLESISHELDKLDPINVLHKDQHSGEKIGRLRWATSQHQLAQTVLDRTESLIHSLLLLLPLQSTNVEVSLALSILKELSVNEPTIAKQPAFENEAFRVLRQTWDLRSLHHSLETNLQQRVANFQQSIPTGDKLLYKPPTNLTVEQNTAGTRSHGISEGRPVIVEWKPYGKWQGQQAILLRGRNDNLARLLHAHNKPEEMITLTCKGYFDDIDMKRYGFVFECPLRSGEQMVSLHRLLSPPVVAEDLPSLESRYEIAHSLSLTLSILHAVGWLHKGLRCHNVLLIRSGGAIRWQRPYVCGFAYSRPDKPDEISEKLEHSERFNVYRHPYAQGQPNENYRPAFDIYSFGVMLFEIAIWGPSFPLWRHDATAFRRELCSSATQSKVQHRMGKQYCDTMIKCLDGHFESATEFNPQIFYSEVVAVLGNL